MPFEVRTARVERTKGESLEAAARKARYGLFAAALAPGEALLTAHQQDDQLETVLLQLLRGAGIAGLAAMPAIAPFAQGLLVRPLLEVQREELSAWVRSQGLRWVEDDTNAQVHLDRNYLRAKVLPAIRARWPGAAATVARAARHAAQAQRLLDLLGAADAARASDGAALSAPVLRGLSPDRRRNALRYWIGASGYLAPPASRLEEIAGPFLAARADRQPLVRWAGARLEREGDRLVLSAGAGVPARVPAGHREADAEELSWRWREGHALRSRFGTLLVKSDARGPIDLDALPPVLSVRSRRGGERLRAVRGGPHRALKRFLQEARVPAARRAELPLLFAGERLIAAADLWLDESVRSSATSRRRARLIWRASSEGDSRAAPRR